MKRKHFIPMLIACLLAPLGAQEPPARPAEDPPVISAGTVHAFAKGHSVMANGAGTALGVSTAPVPRVLQAQMNLKHGLVVNYVANDSTAAKAGLQENDILLRMNDQLLFHPEQLHDLVAYYGAGKKVNVTFLRAGKEQSTECTLIETPVAVTGVLVAEGMAENGQSLRGSISINSLKMIDLNGAKTSVTTPGGAQLWIEMKEGTRWLNIKDAEGKQLFDGPIQTEEQRKNVPEEYRKYLDLSDRPFGK